MLSRLLLEKRLIVALVNITHHILRLEKRIVETAIRKVVTLEWKLLGFRGTVLDISLSEWTLIAMNLELDCIGMDHLLRSTSARLLLLSLFEFLA